MSQGRELGFSCGPEVLPGDIVPPLSALSSLTLLSSSPLPLSFWKSQNLRPEPCYPAGRLRRADQEHPVSESRGLGLCPNQISVLGCLELGLYLEPSHFNTADDCVDLETPFLQKCWCKQVISAGRKGGPWRVRLCEGLAESQPFWHLPTLLVPDLDTSHFGLVYTIQELLLIKLELTSQGQTFIWQKIFSLTGWDPLNSSTPNAPKCYFSDH